MQPQPPKWAIRLLHFYCKPSKLEVIEGDLLELFETRLNEFSEERVKRKFIWDVIRFFRWRNIKGLEDVESLTIIAMFRNYFKVSVRSLIRHKFYSSVNIIGLSVGVACCLYILMFVKHELSYDEFWKDSERIYRVTLNKYGSNTPALLVKQMKEDFPEILQGTRIQGSFESTFNIGDVTIKQDGGINADSTIFEVFDIKFLYGNPKEALTEPNTFVITRSLANKYFPEEDAMGKLVKIDNRPVKVTGIIEDAPKNSHLQYKYILAFTRDIWVTTGNWTGNNFDSYLKLEKNSNASNLESKFPDFVKKYVGPVIIGFSGHNSFDDFLAEGNDYGYGLVPIQDIHLSYPNLSMGRPGKMSNIYIFSTVAFFVLLVACINFMNLSTARSATRSKEVGMRKVLGSLRNQLISQFIVESIVICSISLLLALIMVILFLPQFNLISGKNFDFLDILVIENVFYLLAIGIITGVMAGSYPAFYLSKISPVLALKGVLQDKKSGETLRKTLVSIQFGISIFLIISTLIVYTQINFMTTKDLGLNSRQTVVIKNAQKLDRNIAVFQSFLKSIPEVKASGITSHYPSKISSDWTYNTVEELPIRMSPYNVFVSAEFLDILDLKLVHGRFFNASIATDTASIVVNEAFLKKTNWEEGVVGKQMTRGGESRFNIIGVVKDFHFHSMRTKIRPLILRYNHSGIDYLGPSHLMVSVDGNFNEVLKKIEVQWLERVPNDPFDYVFLDDSFDNLYKSERKFGELFTLFSVLAIFIGALGMVALAAFVIERRMKEVAIRKVMGASISEITFLLLKDFTKLVAIGGLIALPTAYFLGQEWLSNFQFRTDLSLFIYILPIALVIGISWLTVGYQTYITAKSNPATVLQNE